MKSKFTSAVVMAGMGQSRSGAKNMCQKADPLGGMADAAAM
jgi:hypothetical protein